MQKNTVLKLIGLAMLTMVALVIISFIEVAFYSYLINPGQDNSVYEVHAVFSAPYVSGVFGFIIFFLITRYWKKKGFQNALKLTILFPLVYVLLDIVIITAAGVNWSDFMFIFLLANGAKFLGSFLGYKLTNSSSPNANPERP